MSNIVEASSGSMVLYHGGKRWSGHPVLRKHRKGHAEYGAGIYLTTSWQRAKKYAKGGGAVYRMIVRRPQKWLEKTRLDAEEARTFVTQSLGRGKRARLVLDAINKAELRLGGIGEIRAEALLISYVNNDLASGKAGPDLSKFLVDNDIEAYLIRMGTQEDWVVIFNPELILKVEQITSKELEEDYFAWDLPQIKATHQVNIRNVVASYIDEGHVGKYWGSAGSGILFVSGSRALLLKRSPYVEQPRTWGIPGGAIPKNEEGEFKDSWKSALTECKEELGMVPPGIRAYSRYLFKDGDFRFTNYLVEVDVEFEPRRLNWENTDFRWTSYEEARSMHDLHFGIRELMRHKRW